MPWPPLRKQTLTIEIVFDPTMSDPPAKWDWSTLLELSPDESVQIMDYTADEHHPTTTNERNAP